MARIALHGIIMMKNLKFLNEGLPNEQAIPEKSENIFIFFLKKMLDDILAFAFLNVTIST